MEHMKKLNKEMKEMKDKIGEESSGLEDFGIGEEGE